MAESREAEKEVTQSVQTRCPQMRDHVYREVPVPCPDCYSVRVTVERFNEWQPEERWSRLLLPVEEGERVQPAPEPTTAGPIAEGPTGEPQAADGERFYLGLGIDQRRCAACAAYPAVPCAVHRDCVACTGAPECASRLHEHGCPADAEAPRLPEPYGLSAEESEVARRYFAGEATIEELSPVIEAQIQRLIDAGEIVLDRRDS